MFKQLTGEEMISQTMTRWNDKKRKGVDDEDEPQESKIFHSMALSYVERLLIHLGRKQPSEWQDSSM